MDHLGISNIVDSTEAFRVAGVATPDVSTYLFFFSLVHEKDTEKNYYKNFRTFCSHFGYIPERLFIITGSMDCLSLYTS
jgi:hypothetical protein